MEPKSFKIEELESVVEYAKKNKLIRVEMGGIKVELHPSAFHTVEYNLDNLKDEMREAIKMELTEEAKNLIAKENEELLYYSAR